MSGNRLAPQALEDAVSAIYRRHLLLAEAPVEDDLFTLCADSLMAAGIVLDLERTFGVQVPQEVFIETQTIRRVAAWLAGQGVGAEPQR